jgi:hypothetical protein
MERKTATKIANFLSTVFHPRYVTPLASIIIILNKWQVRNIIMIIATIITAIVSSRLEDKYEKEDNFEFKTSKIREKRYTLLGISIIYCFLLYVFNLSSVSTYWAFWCFAFLSLFFAFTVTFRLKLSAHVFYLALNLSGLTLLTGEKALIIPTFFSCLAVGASRIVLKKHSFPQVLITLFFSTICYLFILYSYD